MEVEGFLATHPAVNLAQVVAVPDDKYGEVPAAFVELAPGASASEQEIIDYCKDEIASFKIPRFVRFVEECEWKPIPEKEPLMAALRKLGYSDEVS